MTNEFIIPGPIITENRDFIDAVVELAKEAGYESDNIARYGMRFVKTQTVSSQPTREWYEEMHREGDQLISRPHWCEDTPFPHLECTIEKNAKRKHYPEFTTESKADVVISDTEITSFEIVYPDGGTREMPSFEEAAIYHMRATFTPFAIAEVRTTNNGKTLQVVLSEGGDND